MITFNEKRLAYEVDVKNDTGRHRFSYSMKSYGKYAEILAKITEKTLVRYNNYIETNGEYSIIKTFSRTNGYQDIYVNTSDLPLLETYRWRAAYNNNKSKMYAIATFPSKSKRTTVHMHRLLFNFPEELVIDHIDNDGLNNIRSNLRVTTQSINLRNTETNKFPGISIYESRGCPVIQVKWRTDKCKEKTKIFSINKFGFEKALELAKEYSVKKRLKNGYIIKQKYLDEIGLRVVKVKQV